MSQHFVVETYESQEPRVHAGILQLGFESTWLMVIEEVRVRRSRFKRAVSALPSYLFVLFDINLDNWRPIATLPGVRGLLGSSPIQPQPLRDGAVEDIKTRFNAGEFFKRPPSQTSIRRGDYVEFIAGSYEGEVYRCSYSKRDRIKIMMTYFGRETEVRVDATDVRRVDDCRIPRPFEQTRRGVIDGPPA